MHRRHRSFVAAAVAAVFVLLRAAAAITGGVEVPDSDHRFDSVGFVLLISGDGRTCDNGATANAAYFFQGSCVLIGPRTVALSRHSLAFGQPETYWPMEALRIRFRRAVNGQSLSTFLGPDGQGGVTSCHGIYQEKRVVGMTLLPIDPDWNPEQVSQMVLLTLDSDVVGIAPTPFVDRGWTTGTRCRHRFTVVGWGDARQNYFPQCQDPMPSLSGVFRMGTVRQVINLNRDYFVPHGWQFGPLNEDGEWVGGCQTNADFSCCSFPAGTVAPNRHDSGTGLFVERTAVVNGVTRTETRLLGVVIQSGSLVWGWTAEGWNTWRTRGDVPPVPVQPFTLPARCGDTTGDGAVDLEDLITFIRGYFAGDCDGDANDDGTISVQDIFDYLRAYFGAC